MTKIRYRPSAGTASGRRTGWIKHVISVDPNATDGYGVHGEFLRDGQLVELPVGAIVLKVDPEGSVKHAWQSAHVYRLDRGEDGAAKPVKLTEGVESAARRFDNALDWRQDFLQVRDVLIDASGAEPESLLAGVTDEELLAELRRRMEDGLNIQAWLRALSLLDA